MSASFIVQGTTIDWDINRILVFGRAIIDLVIIQWVLFLKIEDSYWSNEGALALGITSKVAAFGGGISRHAMVVC